MKQKKGVTDYGRIGGKRNYRIELEYETEENARNAFVEIESAYESGKIDVYI